MEIQKFKPGDWVAIKGDLDSPLMQVMNYHTPIPEDSFDNGNNFVRCVFYSNGCRMEKTVHQSRLIKRRIGQTLRRTKTHT